MAHISEKQLEDWICRNSTEFNSFPFEVIGRQVKLEHGILDILGWSEAFGALAIELKAGPLKEPVIAQVLRYTHDINDVFRSEWATMEMWEQDQISEAPNMYEDDLVIIENLRGKRAKTLTEDVCANILQDPPKCTPFLIGTSIDMNTYAAIQGAGGLVLLWREEAGTIRLNQSQIEMDFRPNFDLPGDYTRSLIGRYVQQVISDTDQFFEWKLQAMFSAKK